MPRTDALARIGALLGVALLVAAAAQAGVPEGRTEITIFGGVSLVDVTKENRIGPPIPIQPPGARPPPPGTRQPLRVIQVPLVLKQSQSLGDSLLQGFRVARFLSERAEAGLDFSIEPAHHLRTQAAILCPTGRPCPLQVGQATSLLPKPGPGQKVVAYRYGLGLSYDFARGEARPFLGFSVGGASYSLTDTGRTDTTRTNFALRFGGGLKFYFGRVGARIEAEDALTPDHFLTGKTEHSVQVRGGVAFRLP